MIGNCTICNEVLTVEPDNILDAQRMERCAGNLAHAIGVHMEARHKPEFKKAMEWGLAFAGMVAMSYVSCDAPDFNANIQRGLDALIAETKPRRPPSPIVAPPGARLM